MCVIFLSLSFGGGRSWQMGSAATGWTDSRAVPVAPKEHWPELETLILVVNDAKKDTSSTAGMGLSVSLPSSSHPQAHAVPVSLLWISPFMRHYPANEIFFPSFLTLTFAFIFI